MGGNNEIAIKQMIFKTLESGEKWILLENFQNAHDMRSILKHHVKIGKYIQGVPYGLLVVTKVKVCCEYVFGITLFPSDLCWKRDI